MTRSKLYLIVLLALAPAGLTEAAWADTIGGAACGSQDDKSASQSPSSTSSSSGPRWPATYSQRTSSVQASTKYDQNDARKALLQGKIMPLTAILALAEKRVHGPVMQVALETNDGRLVYRLVILSREGRRVTLELDARTGEILRSGDR